MRGKVKQLRNERVSRRVLQDYSFSPIDGPFQSSYYACTMFAGQRFTSFSFAAFAYRAAAQDRRASALAK
jgi:hypothetical protein